MIENDSPTPTSMSMTAQTQTFSLDPMRVNPVRATVARARALADDLTPGQLAVRERGRQLRDAALATGLYSLAPTSR